MAMERPSQFRKFSKSSITFYKDVFNTSNLTLCREGLTNMHAMETKNTHPTTWRGKCWKVEPGFQGKNPDATI